MQQMYYCPNCRAQVAYGQPYCANCNTVLNWPSAPTQSQYQSSPDQYQQQWNQQQQQWYQSGQQAGPGQDQPLKKNAGPGLLQQIQDHKGAIIKISVAVVVVAGLIVAGVSLQGVIAKWFEPPVVTSFDASAATIIEGQEATLQWDVTGASSVSISPGLGTVAASGSRKVSPEATTTYTLVANSMTGSARKSVTIAVTGILPTINSFTISPGSIYTGQTATVSWNVKDSTAVSIEPGIGSVSPSGTKVISPSSTTKYVLTATNGNGNSTASATLNIMASDAPIITSFSASPATITSSELSTLAWDVIGAKSININQGIGGVASKGSAQVTPSETTTYKLIADSDYGSVTRSVTVTVNITSTTGPAITKEPPAINTFSVSRNSIMLADNVTLNWAVTGARTVSLSPDIGTVPSSGWLMVIPTATTTYKLSAVNTFGTETRETTVTVTKATDGTAPLIRSFTANPSSVPSGGTSSLSWDVKGATVLTINQGIGIPISKYSQAVSPAETMAYTLTAINTYGTDNRTVTISVTP